MKNPSKEYDKVLYFVDKIIVGCEDVIEEAKIEGIHKDAVTIAKLVKKDCCLMRKELEKLWTPAQKNTDTDAK